MVTDPGGTPLEEKQLLSDKEYREACDEYGDEFEAKMGAEALRDILANMDLEDVLEELYEQMHETKSKQIKKTVMRFRIKSKYLCQILCGDDRFIHNRPKYL